MKSIMIILRVVWELLPLASPKSDDEANGVNLHGQGR